MTIRPRHSLSDLPEFATDAELGRALLGEREIKGALRMTMRAADNPQSLITLANAARALGVCDRQLRSLIKEGALRFVNVGVGARPSYRIAPAELQAFILRRTAQCQKSEDSPDEKAKSSGVTISKSEVIDFAAKRAARREETLKRRSQRFATQPRPKSKPKGLKPKDR